MPLRVFRIRTLLLKIISTIITIGGGGSGGIQGPSVYIGGFIGGWIAEKIRVNYIERKTLMLVGIAAVLSAIFKAPLGAFFYAIEIPYKRDFETRCVVPVLIGSIIGLLFSISFNIGFDFKFPSLSMNYMSLLDPFMILLYILFGLYTVLVAVCFIYLDQLVYRFRKSVLNRTGFELVIIAVFSL
ncbi:MAG: chloride channel protein, partial [Thermoprotei archaeon]